jgi:HK97 family phage major capsid protein
MKDLINQAKEVAAAAAAEGRALTEQERATVEQALAGAKALKADAELRKAVDSIGEDLAAAAPKSDDVKGRTAGERLINSPEFKAWHTAATRNGSFDGRSTPNSPSVPVAGMKATITGASDDYAGTLIDAFRVPGADASYARENSVLAQLSQTNVNSDVVDLARVLYYGAGQSVNNAAGVAEGTAPSESTMKFEKVSIPVRDFRAFLPVSNRALADAGQLAGLVDAFLRSSILEAVEDEIISGDGTGETLEGVLEVSGTQSVAFDTDLLTTIRKGITAVRKDGNARGTLAVVMSHDDMEQLDLLNDSGTFYFGGPAAAVTPTVWGIQRIASAAVPAGTAIVGEWNQGVLFQRAPISVALYPQHDDFATKGLTAVVASWRGTFGLVQPAKFAICDLTSGS